MRLDALCMFQPAQLYVVLFRAFKMPVLRIQNIFAFNFKVVSAFHVFTVVMCLSVSTQLTL